MLLDTITKARDAVSEPSRAPQDSQFRLAGHSPAPASKGIYAMYGKRFMDFFGALLMLVVFSPLIVVISLIMLFQYGPVIFGHSRVGHRGESFNCLKFRTMVPDADERLEQLLAHDADARDQWQTSRKLDPDPRVTAIGQFLRRSSLDELPQLINVLRGEMSLVGPRPVTEAELARYGDSADAYLAMRPGLTGKWQVSGRNSVSYATRVAMDAEYARDVTMIGDLGILLRTVGVVLGATGK